MKRFADLSEQEVLALAITNEEEDSRIYQGFADGLRTQYPITLDRAIGGGELPNVRLQRALRGLGKGNVVDRFLTWVHWLWFFEPHLSLVWILVRHNERFPLPPVSIAGRADWTPRKS